MIIQIIHVVDVPIFKPEDHPPVATASNGVKSL
jgi:hypothetical protein